MAVVKADAYGHGDVAVARAALEAGASWLGVALVEEGLRLREAGIEAPDPGAVGVPSPAPRTRRSRPASRPASTRTRRSSDLAAAAGRTRRRRAREGRHRHAPGRRVPARGDDRRSSTASIATGLRLEALWTHFASSAEDEKTTLVQLERFLATVEDVRAARASQPAFLHTANSAATHPVPGDPPRPRPDRDRDLRAWSRLRASPTTGPAPGAHVALDGRIDEAPARRGTRLVRTPLPARARRERRDRAGGLRRRLPSHAVEPGRRPDPGPSMPGGGERDDGSADRGLRRHARRTRRRRRPDRPPRGPDDHRRGARAAGRHDRLRDRHRDRRPGAAGVRRR